MKERPITLHPHELQAAIAGTLTQVRRPVVPQPVCVGGGIVVCSDGAHVFVDADGNNWACKRSPLGQPGDVIWCRERWMPARIHGKWSCKFGIRYEVDKHIEFNEMARPIWTIDGVSKWRRASSMPRWASRWARPVAAVRVERANDISTHDIGCCGINLENNNVGARNEYAINWNRHYAAKGYLFDGNPWVWVADLDSKGE